MSVKGKQVASNAILQLIATMCHRFRYLRLKWKLQKMVTASINPNIHVDTVKNCVKPTYTVHMVIFIGAPKLPTSEKRKSLKLMNRINWK